MKFHVNYLYTELVYWYIGIIPEEHKILQQKIFLFLFYFSTIIQFLVDIYTNNSVMYFISLVY